MKGLDYALLHKIRSEIDKVPEDEDNIKQRYFILETSKLRFSGCVTKAYD